MMDIDYKEIAKENLAHTLAGECIGIYPKSIVNNGIKEERTEWQDGWNACAIKITEYASVIEGYLESLPENVIDYIFAEKIYVAFYKKPSLYVNCNDLFYWACADDEDIELSDIDDFEAAMKESPGYGDILWACRKRGMRPQKPFYKHFSDAEKLLFDACGPERDE